MSNEPIHSWEFDITNPEEVAGALRSGDPPTGDVRFITDQKITGEQVYREDSLFGINLSRFARAIPTLLAGDSVEIELDASTVHLTPQRGEQSIEVYVDMYGVPDHVRGYEPDIIATESFVLEVYETCLDWYEGAKEIEPQLKREEWFTELHDALLAAYSAVTDAGFSSTVDEPT